MRILHTVEFYEPSKGGAQEVAKQLSERLAVRGHQVTVATSYHPSRSFSQLNGVNVQSFKIKGNSVKHVRGEIGRYIEFLLNSQFDVVMNYAAQTWTTDLTFGVLDRLKARKVAAPLGYSRLHDERYRQYFRELPGHLRKYDRLVYTSENYQDKQFGDRYGLRARASVIPNGASSEEFSSAPKGFRQRYGVHTKYMFLTVSNHYFAKGHRTAIEAFHRASIPDSTLVIIGDRPSLHSWYSCYPLCAVSGLLDPSVKILADVPREWVVSAFQEADLFLFASQLECAPLVMYECFASRTPFITTPVGNVADHSNLIDIVVNTEEMASRIQAFIAEPEGFARRVDLAREAFEREFSWSTITEKFEALYVSL